MRCLFLSLLVERSPRWSNSYKDPADLHISASTGVSPFCFDYKWIVPRKKRRLISLIFLFFPSFLGSRSDDFLEVPAGVCGGRGWEPDSWQPGVCGTSYVAFPRLFPPYAWLLKDPWEAHRKSAFFCSQQGQNLCTEVSGDTAGALETAEGMGPGFGERVVEGRLVLKWKKSWVSKQLLKIPSPSAGGRWKGKSKREENEDGKKCVCGGVV